jgi:putative oxidoreductase
METGTGIKTKILGTGNDSRIIFARIITGLIFISEGIQKYVIVTMLGPAYFKEIGFGNPLFWSYFTGTFEILCGTMILLGLLTRLASIPLFIIMLTAFFKTKLPLMLSDGFLTFAHEYRIDFALTLLLIMLFIHGAGKWSVDLKILNSKAHRL